MALVDWQDTQHKLILALEEKGRKEEWLIANLLKPTEDRLDLEALIYELKQDGKVHNQYGYLHLITEDSEARRKAGKKEPKEQAANSWAWYAWMPESYEFRVDIRSRFTKEDAKVFKALAAIITNERAPRLGTRVSGPITEEEGRYIVKVNEALMSYVERMKDG